MVSMAPIASEANPVTSCIPPHFGDTISEVPLLSILHVFVSSPFSKPPSPYPLPPPP